MHSTLNPLLPPPAREAADCLHVDCDLAGVRSVCKAFLSPPRQGHRDCASTLCRNVLTLRRPQLSWPRSARRRDGLHNQSPERVWPCLLPDDFPQFLLCAQLLPFKKKDDGVRPMRSAKSSDACPAKVALKQVMPAISEYFPPSPLERIQPGIAQCLPIDTRRQQCET